MIISKVTNQPDVSNIRVILLKRSWNTHIKHSNQYILILQKVNKLPDGMFNHLLFASKTILIFDGLFLHRLSRLLNGKTNYLRL